MQLARARALAPNMEKTTRALSLAELSDLLGVPRKTIESAESSFSSAERIRPLASFSRATSDNDSLYPEPTGNGFARLRRRLRDAGLL